MSKSIPNGKLEELEKTWAKARDLVKDISEDISANESQLLDLVTQKVALDTIDEKALGDFAKTPYLIMPKGKNEAWIIVPRFVDFHVGWLERQTSSYNVFIVNQYIDMISPLPHDIKARVSIEPYLEKAILQQRPGKVGILEINPLDYERAKEKYKNSLGNRVSGREDQIYLKKGKEFSLLAELIRDGMLPFEPKPVAEDDLRPENEWGNKIKLREYQERAFDSFIQYGAVGIYWAPGAGKTFVSIETGNRVMGDKLVVVPQLTLKEQWEERIKEYAVSPGEWEVQTYQYITHKHNYDRFAKREWKIIFYDECFPYYDQIYTEYGQIPIGWLVENKIQCKVWSYNFTNNQLELKPITFFYRKHASSVLEIETENSIIHPTKTHNIYTPEGNHLPANELKLLDETIYLRNMWTEIQKPSRPQWPQNAPQTPGSQREVKQENSGRRITLEQDKPRCLGEIQKRLIKFTHEREQSILERRGSSANVGANSIRGLSLSQGMYDLSREVGCNTDRYSPQEWRSKKQLERESYGFMPFLSRKSTPRGWSHYTTVDNIRGIRELTLNDPRVYDLEVADNHNYFINGVLVSNCHHLPANTFSKLAVFKTDYRIGLSASPYREDGRTEYIFALTGFPIGLRWRELISLGAVGEPDVKVYLYSTEFRKRADLDNLIKTRSGKILVFCDSVPTGNTLAKAFGVPFVYGKTRNRLEIVRDNRVVLISRVGDEGMSIPDLDTVIEYDFLYGSRRQETQRAGRLMHNKKGGEHIIMMTEVELSKYEKRLYGLEEQGFNIRFERRA